MSIVADRVEQEIKRDELEQRRESARRAEEDKALRRRDSPELVFKTKEQQEREPAVVSPRITPNEVRAWREWVDRRIADEFEARLDALTEGFGEALGTKVGELRGALMREVDFIKREVAVLRDAAEIERGLLRTEIAAVKENAPRLLDVEAKTAELRSEMGLLRREFVILRDEVAVERGLSSLRQEIAAAQAAVPQIPAIEARVAAKQSALERKVAKLERELAVTKDKLASVRVENSELRYGLTLLEKKQLPKPAIQVSLSTSDSSFILKDEDPGALSAWQRFLDCAISSNPDAEASVKGRANGSA